LVENESRRYLHAAAVPPDRNDGLAVGLAAELVEFLLANNAKPESSAVFSAK
jgi:hypothetical protein